MKQGTADGIGTQSHIQRARSCPEFVIRKIRKKAAAVARKQHAEVAKSLNRKLNTPPSLLNQENVGGVNWLLVRTKMKRLLSDNHPTSQSLLTQKLRPSKLSSVSTRRPMTSLWSASKTSVCDTDEVDKYRVAVDSCKSTMPTAYTGRTFDDQCVNSQGLYKEGEAETHYRHTSQLERTVQDRIPKAHKSLLEGMLASQEFTDLVVSASDGQLKCHKAVLHLHYPKLKPFLESNNTLDLTEASVSEIKDWLSSYVYSSQPLTTLNQHAVVENLLKEFYDYSPVEEKTDPIKHVKPKPQTKQVRKVVAKPKRSKGISNLSEPPLVDKETVGVNITTCPSTIKVEPKVLVESANTDSSNKTNDADTPTAAVSNPEKKAQLKNKSWKRNRSTSTGKNRGVDENSCSPASSTVSPLFSFC